MSAYCRVSTVADIVDVEIGKLDIVPTLTQHIFWSVYGGRQCRGPEMENEIDVECMWIRSEIWLECTCMTRLVR